MSLKITKSTTINASTDTLWRILIDEFAEVGAWASSVNNSRANSKAKEVPEGASVAGRVCTLGGFGETEEAFTHFDAKKKSFAYYVKADGLPGFVSNLQNRWDLHAVSPNKTRVTNTVTADLSGIMGTVMKPLMKMQFKGTLKTILADLAHYAETGEVSPEKRKAQQKAKRKTAAL